MATIYQKDSLPNSLSFLPINQFKNPVHVCYPQCSSFSWCKIQPTFPVVQHNHHTTLRIESNQSRRRPTSWSFCRNSPTPVSMRSPCREVELFLLLRLKPRFQFLRNLERMWSLSSLKLSFLNPPFLFFRPPPSSPIPLFGLRWVKGLSSLLPHVHF